MASAAPSPAAHTPVAFSATKKHEPKTSGDENDDNGGSRSPRRQLLKIATSNLPLLSAIVFEKSAFPSPQPPPSSSGSLKRPREEEVPAGPSSASPSSSTETRETDDDAGPAEEQASKVALPTVVDASVLSPSGTRRSDKRPKRGLGYKTYSPADMQRAYQIYVESKKFGNSISIRRLAKVSGIPYATLRDHINGRRGMKHNYRPEDHLALWGGKTVASALDPIKATSAVASPITAASPNTLDRIHQHATQGAAALGQSSYNEILLQNAIKAILLAQGGLIPRLDQ